MACSYRADPAWGTVINHSERADSLRQPRMFEIQIAEEAIQARLESGFPTPTID